MLGSCGWLSLLTVAGAAAILLKSITSRAATSNVSAVACKGAIATTSYLKASVSTCAARIQVGAWR